MDRKFFPALAAGVIAPAICFSALADTPAAPPASTASTEAETAAPSSEAASSDAFASLTEPVDDLRSQLEEDYNLTFGLGSTLIWQFTDGANVVDQTNSLVTGSYDFDGFWEAIDEDTGFGTGGLGFVVEGGHNLDHNRSEDLAANVGSALGINDDADPTTDIAITELFWNHSFGPVTVGRPVDPTDKQFEAENLAAEAEEVTRLFTLYVGKIDQSAFFDGNEVANDETAQFLATPLVNSVAVAFPDNGIGVNLRVQPNELFYFSGGFGDANAVATRGPTDFEFDELFWAGELGVTPEIEGLGAGAYRVLFWTTEYDNGAGGTVDGSGISFSLDQEVLPGVIPFFRYSTGDEDVLDFEQMFSFGVGFADPFDRHDDDQLSVGFAQGEPSNSTADDEKILEAFYRYTICDTISITPAVQAVFDPIDNPDESTVVIGVIRTQFTF